MTAAPEIQADVMAAAREVLRSLSAISALDTPLETAIARAILAERQRCVEVVRAEMCEPDNQNYSPHDPIDQATEHYLRRALSKIQGPRT